MKKKLLTLTLFFTFGFILNQPFLAAAEHTSAKDILEGLPSPYQAAQYTYTAGKFLAWGAVAYITWKAYNNKIITKNLGAAYNFITSGDTLSSEAREQIELEITARNKAIEETARAVSEHTLTLGTLNLKTTNLLGAMQILQKSSENFATKDDIAGLKRDLTEIKQQLNLITEQTKNGIPIENYFRKSKR